VSIRTLITSGLRVSAATGVLRCHLIVFWVQCSVLNLHVVKPWAGSSSVRSVCAVPGSRSAGDTHWRCSARISPRVLRRNSPHRVYDRACSGKPGPRSGRASGASRNYATGGGARRAALSCWLSVCRAARWPILPGREVFAELWRESVCPGLPQPWSARSCRRLASTAGSHSVRRLRFSRRHRADRPPPT